jgi:hypothetical protein
MNEEFFARFRKPPRPQFEAALYERISRPMTNQSKAPALRLAALPLGVLAVLALTILAVPSARTFAQNLFVQIGVFAFSQGTPQPYDASRVPGPITIVRTENSVAIEMTGSNYTSAHNLVEAGDLAGFGVLAPSYLPADFIGGSEWVVMSEGNGTVVMSGYHDSLKNMLFISQWKAGEGDVKAFTRETIVEVTVRGQSGVWLPDDSPEGGDNALVWEENGITYSLISDGLGLDELMKVAESLGG